MALPVDLIVSGTSLIVSGNIAAGANMWIQVPVTIDNLYVSGSTVNGDLYVSGTITATEFKTLVISSSIIYRSGSTKQGDTLDDIHEVTGSLRVYGGISGSLSGSFTGVAMGSLQGTEGLTGSLQRLVSGPTYLAAGPGIQITTQSNGQVVIANKDEPPTAIGQVLIAITTSSFSRALPITSLTAGWLVNAQGFLLVSGSN